LRQDNRKAIWRKRKKPKGEIIVISITADIPRMLPDNSSDMTEEQIHKSCFGGIQTVRQV
jgi:hypothetical protein